MTTRQSPNLVEISIGEGLHSVERPRLGTHLDLRVRREALDEAVQSGDNGKITDCLFEYLALAIPELDRGLFESAPWFQVFNAYIEISNLNSIPNADSYAILSMADERKGEIDPWSYLGRSRAIWYHLLAHAYGWTIDEIRNLWPDQAVELLMEILADEFNEREFVYSLSEIAYEYDKNTKKSRYRPLRKPLWMIQGSEESKEKRKSGLITRIRKDSLPTGNIIRSK